jgi:hypothetical protein
VDYDLQYDLEHQVLLVLMGSTVTEASALAAYNAVRRFIAAVGPCSTIADLSRVQIANVTGCVVQSLASMPRATGAGNRLVLVAPQPVIYGLSRMFHLCRGETEQCAVVRTLEEAYALLDLVRPDFRAVEDKSQLAGAA